jgi:chromosome segregation ATPase
MPTTTRKRPSLGELADRFESALAEKKDLERRLSNTLGEVDGERSRLNSEITSLRGQLEQLQKKSKKELDDAIRQRKTLEEYDSERSRLDLEIMALRSQVEQLQRKNKSESEEAIRQRAVLGENDGKQSRLQQENTGLRAMIEQLQRKNKIDAEDTARQRKALSEFESERSRLNSEIAALRAQIGQQKKSESGAEGATPSSAKERLIKDELERKFQAAIVETRREQKRCAEQVAQLKIKLSKCICQGSGSPDWA